MSYHLAFETWPKTPYERKRASPDLSPAEQINSLEKKVREQEWTIDILNTKVGIFRKKLAEKESSTLAGKYWRWLQAEKQKVKELEKLLELAQIDVKAQGGELSLDTLVSPARIDEVVSAHYGVAVAVLRSPKRTSNEVAKIRGIAMYLQKKLTPATLDAIADYYGGRHHSTAINGIKNTKRKLKSEAFRQNLEALIAEIRKK